MSFKKIAVIFVVIIFLMGSLYVYQSRGEDSVALETISEREKNRLEELLYQRQSIRDYSDVPLSLSDVESILWAAEGINIDGVSGPTRTSPSAGATNPLQIYLLINNVENLEQGIYRYHPEDEELSVVKQGDFSGTLAQAALGQGVIREAQAVLVVAAKYERTTQRYGERGVRYVHFEAGHAAQNAVLMAEELKLGSVIIGAFDDQSVSELLNFQDKAPLLLIPFGIPNSQQTY